MGIDDDDLLDDPVEAGFGRNEDREVPHHDDDRYGDINGSTPENITGSTNSPVVVVHEEVNSITGSPKTASPNVGTSKGINGQT